MVKCPRCSFEQPEDVFCASCGVNMQNYKTKHSRPWPVMAIIAVIVILLIGFSIKKFTGALDQVTQRTDILAEAMNEPTPTPATNTITEAPPSLRRGDPGNGIFAAPTKPSQATAAAAETPALTVTPAAAVPAPAKISNQMTVEFALVPKDSMNKLTLAVGQPSSNLISKTKFEEASHDTGFQNLSSESHTLNTGQIVSVNQGIPEPRTKEYIGFMMKITLNRANDTSADYKIQIKRNLPIISQANDIKINSEDFSENINIAAGQVFAISGLLPRKPIMANEEQLYSTNVLRALLEPSFQKFDQEFVVFFTP